MDNIPKFLIFIGIVFVIVGLLWTLAGRFLHLGHLPGDFSIERENFKFYFPLGTSIVLSLLISFIFWLVQKFGR